MRDGSLAKWPAFHSFGRGFTTTLYALGVDDTMVHQILRHQDVGVMEQVVSAMAKLAALCADGAPTAAPVKRKRPN